VTIDAAPSEQRPLERPARAEPGSGKILVVDDQRNMRATTAIVLRSAGHTVDEAEDGAAALQRIQQQTFDVVLTDLRMPTVDGMELLREAQRLAPETQVIVMTAYGTIESAVDAIRQGAYDFLAKPFKEDELLLRVAKALEKRRLLGEVNVLAGEFRRRYGLEHIIGRSAAMQDVLDRVARVAPSDATVLLSGESGTGKELVARALHVASRRGERPFIPVNCAAITETLLESELFGHAKGAFTGASRARRGLFEEANGGTLFVDEIGETSPGFQAKLLRALQEGEIRRVGESAPAGHRGDEPGPPPRHRREAVPRGPVLSARGRPHPPSAAARAARGRAAPRRPLPASLRAAHRSEPDLHAGGGRSPARPRLARKRPRARERHRARGGARGGQRDPRPRRPDRAPWRRRVRRGADARSGGRGRGAPHHRGGARVQRRRPGEGRARARHLGHDALAEDEAARHRSAGALTPGSLHT
jgi:CheY-like chemotaxis protein